MKLLQKKIFQFFVILFFILITTFKASAQFDWLSEIFNSQKHLSDKKIVSGLKEALKVGIQNAIKTTGKPNGYFNNESIKILLPEKFEILDKTLRTVGAGEKLDEFILSMNRAAEKAAPEAKDIFLDAIFDMTFDNVITVYKGGDTAATDYLKEKTYSKLVEKYQPTVKETLAKYDVTKKYNEIVDKYESIPFVNKFMALDLDHYVLQKALDGLFHVLGEEESKIRKDPAARVTKLLREVFKNVSQ